MNNDLFFWLEERETGVVCGFTGEDDAPDEASGVLPINPASPGQFISLTEYFREVVWMSWAGYSPTSLIFWVTAVDSGIICGITDGTDTPMDYVAQTAILSGNEGQLVSMCNYIISLLQQDYGFLSSVE